jgi:hypothetical protein
MAGEAEYGAINSAQAKLALQKTWSFFPMSAMSRGLAMPAIILISSVFLCVLCGSDFQFLRSLQFLRF